MAEKPRQVVPDLGNLPALAPAADPRYLDHYVRPGSEEFGRPAQTNPMLQLSDALSKLEPTLQRATTMVSERYGADEVAQGEKEFWENREKWNALIRQGQLPEGASPYYQRGLQRASLKQMAGDFYAQTHADFYGEAGAEARASNDPAVMSKFLNTEREKFYAGKLKNGEKDLFSALDLQDVFNPSAEATYKTMLQTHAAYRVSEREKEYENLVSAQITGSVEQNLAQIQPTDNDEIRHQWIAQAARVANDALYNPDTGAVKNGMLASKGNQILIDTITTKMMKTGNRDYKAVLEAITTKDGAPIANTQYAQAKILAAEEHITDQQMKVEHFQHWKKGLPFEELSREHTLQEWGRQDQRWDRELQTWQTRDVNAAEDNITNAFARRIFEGLRRDAKEGAQVIDAAIREAEKILPLKDVEHLKSMVHTAMKQRVDYDDDPMTVAQIRRDISMNPLSFSYDRLTDAVKDHLMKPSTMLQMADDLERNRQNGDHAFMKQPEFTSMLHKVEKSMAQSIGEDEFGEGAIRASEAVGDFRDLAVEWIEKNPQGSISAFRNYMRSQIQDVAERHNAAYGATEKHKRDKQEKTGALIRDTTSANVGEREQKLKDAEEDKRKAQERADEPRRRAEQERQEVEKSNEEFKPTGKKTSEGRFILQREDGTIATERTATVTDKRINDGRPTNIPTIFGGKFHTEKEAADIIAKNDGVDPETGRKLRGYYSINDAVIAARERSARLGKEYSKETPKEAPKEEVPKDVEPPAQPKRKLSEGSDPIRDAERAAGVVELPTTKKLTPRMFSTLLNKEDRDVILKARDRVLKPGISEKPLTEAEFRDLLVKKIGPFYQQNGQSIPEMVEGVEEILRVFLKKKE